MRIAIGGIVHETNTYAVESFGMTGLDDFDVRRGDGVLRFEGTRTFTGGMIAAGREGGHDLVPVLHAFAQPSGTIEAGVYRMLADELVAGIRDVLPVDAVVIDTHGAGIVDGIDDLEADLGAAIRAVIGPEVPLLTTLDLHGSITEEMNEVYDLMLGVYDYPHVDMYERGVEAVEAAVRIARAIGGRPPTSSDFRCSSRPRPPMSLLLRTYGAVASMSAPSRVSSGLRSSTDSPTPTFHRRARPSWSRRTTIQLWPAAVRRRSQQTCGIAARTSDTSPSRRRWRSGKRSRSPLNVAARWWSTTLPTTPVAEAQVMRRTCCGRCSKPTSNGRVSASSTIPRSHGKLTLPAPAR
jgi:hypothetical protein